MRYHHSAPLLAAILTLATPSAPAAADDTARSTDDVPDQPMWTIVGVEVRVVATLVYRLRRLDPNGEGISVGRIRRGSPAERAGLRTYDVLVRWNGNEVSSFEQMEGRAARLRPGQRAKVTYRRWNWMKWRWQTRKATLRVPMNNDN